MKTIGKRRQPLLSYLTITVTVVLSFACPGAAQQKTTKTDAATGASVNAGHDAKADAAASDPVIQAMREELERSKAHVKMENVSAPYYIEYRLSDLEEYTAEAAFGALRQNQHVHARSIRVVVRVGDYKQDSYFERGIGVFDLAPLDNDNIALRRQLWAATDRAYKAANEALASKKALLSHYSAEQPFDDFAKAPALQTLEPLAKLEFSPEAWEKALVKSTDLFRSDPKSNHSPRMPTFGR